MEWLIAWFWDIIEGMSAEQSKCSWNVNQYIRFGFMLLEVCLTYNLEDKIDFEELGNDMIIWRPNNLQAQRETRGWLI